MEGHKTATPAGRRSGTATLRPGSGAAHGTTLEGILERVTYANDEVLAIWIRQLILRAIELGIGWLVQKVMRRRKAARTIPFPNLRPVP